MVLVLFLGVGLKFETQPQVTMWHRSAQEPYLPMPKMTRSLGDQAMAQTHLREQPQLPYHLDP